MTTGAYEGVRAKGGHGVLFDGKYFDPCTHLFDYRSGYSWGNDGPGTMQLALAMLVHCYGGTEAGVEAALRHHRDFARDVLAPIEGDSWVIFHEQLRQMLEARVSAFHSRTPAGRVADTLVYRREDAGIQAAAEQAFEKMVGEIVMDGIDKLPEVLAYLEIRDKNDGISEALQKIDLDLRQIDLDREKATATLQGAKLATKLATLDNNRKTLEVQIGDVQKGGELFQRDVQTARAAASEAIQRHFDTGLYVMQETAKKGVETTREVLRKIKAAELFRLMDDAAVARHVREIVKTKGAEVRQRVFAVIADPVA
jgi:hypothetical protein